MSAPELQVTCPKCKALPGVPCQSIRRDGQLTCRVYRTHKKRKVALIMGAQVLSNAVPARPVRRTGPQVGLVDSAARGL